MYSIDSKEYWAIVAKDDVGDLWIIKQSKDTKDDRVFDYGGASLFDNNVNIQWADSEPMGLYKIELSPTWDSDGYVDNIGVDSHHKLYEIMD